MTIRTIRVCVTICAILPLLWVGIVFASPPGSKYTPGQTLNPSCAPGDTNCAVEPPLTAVGTGAITTTQILDGTVANIDIASSAAIAFSKLNISSSDIRGLGAYSAGTGLTLSSGIFSIGPTVVTSNYGGAVQLAGAISPHKITASVSDSDIPNTLSNTSVAMNAGVLKLSLPSIIAPASANHYIDFHDAMGSIGSIRGTGAGGVTLAGLIGNEAAFNARPGLQFISAGADYAEYLPLAEGADDMLAAEIVGVSEGRISRVTAGADRAMVVSTSPIILGNAPQGDVAGYETIAFVGQVPVRVIGPVLSGQYIVPSGMNDGLGIAKYQHELTPDDLVVGQAWQSDATAGETIVNVALVPGPVVTDSPELRRLHDEVESLKQDLADLKRAAHE